MTCVSLFLALASLRVQGEGSDEGRPRVRTSAFFRASRVDFWGDAAEAKSPPTPGRPEESIWAEPVRLPDGRFTVYVPPPAVLRFVEHPTRETGEQYLAWQKERMEKLRAALEILAALQAQRPKGDGVEGPPPTPPSGRRPGSPGRSSLPLVGEILYFKKEGCPACREQDLALAEFARSNPGVKIRTLAPSEMPELWKEYGVTAVPAIVLTTASGRKTLFRGFTAKKDLIRAFHEPSRAGH